MHKFLIYQTYLDKKQKEIAKKNIIDLKPSFRPEKGDIILALDVQYSSNIAFVAGDLQYWRGEQVGLFVGYTEGIETYQPGLFYRREGTVLYAFVKHLQQQNIPKVNILLLDAHGIAHPQRFGLASWLGLALEIPSIGCAKRTLLPYENEPQSLKGSFSEIILSNETLGYALRTQNNVKPVFVSPGHLINLITAKNLVLGLVSDFRLPDNQRRADQAARAYAKGEKIKNAKDLGEILVLKNRFEDKN